MRYIDLFLFHHGCDGMRIDMQYLKELLDEKLIIRSIELDRVALRDPITPKQWKDRKDWERIKNILNKRYENKT